MNARRKTFTLIELLTVVVIIMVLAGLVIGGAKFAFEKSQQSAIKMEMKTLEMALQEYKNDWGHYPVWTDKKLLEGSGYQTTGTVELGTDPVPDEEFMEENPYTKDYYNPLFGLIKGDAWNLDFPLNAPTSKGGNPYLGNRSTQPLTQLDGVRAARYRYPGVINPQKYDLIFPGHDGTFGTSDDISNWTQR